MPKIRNNFAYILLFNNLEFWTVFNLDKVVLSKNKMYIRKGYVSDGLLKLNVMVIKLKNNKFISSAYILEFPNL